MRKLLGVGALIAAFGGALRSSALTAPSTTLEVGWISREPRVRAPVDVFLDQNGHPYRDTYSAESQLTLAMNADGVVMLNGDALESQPPWRQPPKA
jgi:hypothetical protein